MTTAILVTCPRCHSKNRLPAERLTDGGKCGRCKAALFDGHPAALTAQSFDAHLQSDLPLVVDFWAPWCGPCRTFAPTFEQAARVMEPAVRLAKVDTEAEPALAQRFAIRSIPTLILFRQGREVSRMSGALPGNALVQWIKQHAG
jgi:thioredoxin 2